MKKPSSSVPSEEKHTLSPADRKAEPAGETASSISPSQENLHVSDDAYFMNLNHGSRAGFDVENWLRSKALAEAYKDAQSPELKAPFLKPI